ncbi:MAG: hypothetical protein DRQ78_00810 [Epsilonproteobacteria bacterium]|nr:MAG: hypothetical protein DRQ78_00810 [Campylobacterota bacterium]
MNNFFKQFTQQDALMAGGAVFGAWTQDPIDNPLAGLAGAAIGAYTGYSVADDFNDMYKQLTPKNLTIDDIARRRVDVSAAVDNSILLARESLDREIENLGNSRARMMVKGLGAGSAEYDEIMQVGKNLSTVIGEDFSGAGNPADILNNIENYYGTIKDDRRGMMQLKDVISNRSEVREMSGGVIERTVKNDIPIRSADSAEQIENKLYQHFSGNLSNEEALARTKAKDMAPVLSHMLENQSITGIDIEDSQLIFRSRETKDVKFNLTSKTTDNISFVEQNGMRQITRGISPFGKAYSDETAVTLMEDGKSVSRRVGMPSDKGMIDITKQHDPEEMMSILFRANENTMTLEELSKLSTDTGALSLHSAPDSRKIIRESVDSFENSAYARRISQTTEMAMVLDQTGDRARFINMKPSIEGSDMRSEVSTMMNKMVLGEGVNPLTNQGMNALTLVTPSKFSENLHTPGFLPAEDRGASSVSFRDHVPVHASTSEYLKLKEKTGGRGVAELRGAASHGTRIHVSSEMSDLFSGMYGNKFSIDDGHGIANEAQKKKFKVKQSSSVTIGNTGDALDSKFLLSMDIPEEILKGSRENAVSYLRDNPIYVGAGQTLGYDKQGRAASLASHFTAGKLKDVVKSKDGLELVFSALYQPKDWTKIFGTSSKSGLTFAGQDEFAKMGALSLAESRGIISVDKNQIILNKGQHSIGKMKKGVRHTPDKFAEKFFDSNIGKSLMEEASSATMIQRWEDIKMDPVRQILTGKASDSKAAIDEVVKSAKGQGFDKYLKKMSSLGNSKADKAEKAAIYKTMVALSGHRAGQDMFLTMGEHLARASKEIRPEPISPGTVYKDEKHMPRRPGFGNRVPDEIGIDSMLDDMMTTREREANLAKSNMYLDDIKFLDRLEEKGVGFTEPETDRLLGIMRKTGGSFEGKSYTQFTSNVGEAIHGAGNMGSMSWLEYDMLNSMKMPTDIINSMTELNRGALQELSMVESTFFKGDFGHSSFKPGEDVGKIMHDVFKMPAEDRQAFMKRIGINTSGTMANYTLSNKVEGIKSVPVGFEDTNYTGLKNYAGMDMLFETEQSRQNVINADIALTNSTTDAAKLRSQGLLDYHAKELLSIQGRMMSGENNLRKIAAKRIAKDSMILTARPSGAPKRADKNVVYVSQSLAEKMYKRQGLNIEDHMSMDGDIGELKNKNGQRLFAQISREPVQGPFSSMGFQIKVDKSLDTKGDHIFIPKANEILNKFAFLDYDADHLRMLPLFALSKKQTEDYMSHNNRMLKHTERLMGVQEKLGIKGASKHLDLVTKFEDSTEKERHMLSQGELGRLRKTDSPEVTRMVTEFNKALNIEGKGKEVFAEGRVLGHNLTENLLKSQHKASGSPMRGAVQELAEAQADFMRDKDKKTYKSRISSIIDDTIGGSIHTINPETATKDRADLALYKKGLKDLVNASAEHHINIAGSMETFLGPAGYKDMSSAEVQQAIIEHGGFQSGEGPIPSRIGEVDVESVKHSAKKMYNNAATAVASFMSKNKGKLVAAGLGLAGISIMARDTPEQLASSSPIGSEKQILQPLPDKKGYIRKHNPDRNISVSASVYSGMDNMNSGSLDRALFGDNIGSVSVNITDKSGMF